MRRRVAVGLGSNLGDRLAALQRARSALGRLGTPVATSSLYSTAPVGGPEQGDYLNAVVVLDTPLEPEELLTRLLSIETSAGRIRRERWGPRLLDLDLIVMTDPAGAPISHDTEHLKLPHPRAARRRFVLEPLAEVWPDAPLGPGATAAGALGEVADQEVVEVADRTWHLRRRLRPGGAVSAAYVAGQLVAFGAYGLALAAAADGPRPARRWALVAALGGLIMATSASRSLGSALSPFPEPVAGASVVERGAYRWIRHPIYAGIVLLLGGVAVAFGAWGALAVDAALGLLFSFKARHEEDRLVDTRPGYEAYMRRVRGRLFPRPAGRD